MYLVLVIKPDIEISVFGMKTKIPFSTAGFYGVCPIFKDKKDALDYADGKYEVIKVTEGAKI